MNLHLSKHLSPSHSSQTLAFLSLTPRHTNQLTLPTLSTSNTPRRSSCSHHPSLSPKALSKEAPQVCFATPIKRMSTFASKSAKRLSVFPLRNSPNLKENNVANSAKSSLTKDVQPILKASVISVVERLNKASFLDSSFGSAFSDKLRSIKKEPSAGRSSRGLLSGRSKLKSGKAGDQLEEKVQLGKVIRRKSCYCSDCGGISKKERTHMNVVEPCPRVEFRNLQAIFKLSFAESKDESSGGLGSNKSLKSGRRMSRRSFAIKMSPKSLTSLQPRASVKPTFQTMKTMSFFGGNEDYNRQSYSLSKFALAKKCSTLNVLHDEDESISSKNTLEKRKKTIGKSINEFLEGDQDTDFKNSIEEMGEVHTDRKRNALYTPSLDLDLQKFDEENKKNQDEQDGEITNKNRNISIEKFSQINEVVKKEPAGESKNVIGSLNELKKIKTEKQVKLTKTDQKSKKKYLNILDLKTQKKVKELAIQQIYRSTTPFISSVSQTSFKSPKFQLTTKSGTDSFKDFFEKRKLTMDTLSTNTERLDTEMFRKSPPQAMFDSIRALNNKTPVARNNIIIRKEQSRGQSLSARKNIQDEKGEIIQKLRISGEEKSHFKDRGEVTERILLKTSDGRRRKMKTLGTVELKKVYKASM